jgi:hypothetical protein
MKVQILEKISRKEAIRKGLKRYYTGKLCIKEHDCERYTSNGDCCECANIKNINYYRKKMLENPKYGAERKRIYNKKNKDKVRKWRKNFRENNPEKVKKWHAEWRKKNRDKLREYYRNWEKNNPEKSKKYYENNEEKIKLWKKKHYQENRSNILKCNRELQKSHRDNLDDVYIKSRLRGDISIKSKDIPQELIELKRIQLKIYRYVKEDSLCHQLQTS